jgi:hypothetical protein
MSEQAQPVAAPTWQEEAAAQGWAPPLPPGEAVLESHPLTAALTQTGITLPVYVDLNPRVSTSPSPAAAPADTSPPVTVATGATGATAIAGAVAAVVALVGLIHPGFSVSADVQSSVVGIALGVEGLLTAIHVNGIHRVNIAAVAAQK